MTRKVAHGYINGSSCKQTSCCLLGLYFASASCSCFSVLRWPCGVERVLRSNYSCFFSAIQLTATKSGKWKEKLDWHVTMFGVHLQRLLGMHCPWHARVKGQQSACIDWQTKQPSQVDCVSEDLKCWGAWDTACRHKDKDITSQVTHASIIKMQGRADPSSWLHESS